MAVIVYGLQGCGKTRYKEIMRAHFGMRQVIDDWLPGDALPEDALALTHVPCDRLPEAVPFREVMGKLAWPDCRACAGRGMVRAPYSSVPVACGCVADRALADAHG